MVLVLKCNPACLHLLFNAPKNKAKVRFPKGTCGIPQKQMTVLLDTSSKDPQHSKVVPVLMQPYADSCVVNYCYNSKAQPIAKHWKDFTACYILGYLTIK